MIVACVSWIPVVLQTKKKSSSKRTPLHAVSNTTWKDGENCWMAIDECIICKQARHNHNNNHMKSQFVLPLILNAHGRKKKFRGSNNGLEFFFFWGLRNSKVCQFQNCLTRKSGWNWKQQNEWRFFKVCHRPGYLEF